MLFLDQLGRLETVYSSIFREVHLEREGQMPQWRSATWTESFP